MDGLVLPPHPFYPIEANIVGYLANELSVLSLLGVFGSGCVVILGLTLALVMRQNPTLPSREKAIVLWFVLCKFAAIRRERCNRSRHA